MLHSPLCSQFLVFKFFASAKKEGEESTEQKVAVHSVQAFGHKYSQDELLNLEFLNKLYDVAKLPSATTEEGGGDNVEGGVVLVRVLGFLATMLRDLQLLHKRRKAASLDPTLISVSDTSYAMSCSLCHKWRSCAPGVVYDVCLCVS